MLRTLWLIMPLVMSACMYARDHDHDHEYDDSWEYDASLELEGGHDGHRRGSSGDSPDTCVAEADEDASLSNSDRAASQRAEDTEHTEDAATPRCESTSDCEAMMYCEQDAGECLPGVACEDESSCDPGFNCDPDWSLCTPTDREHCSELADESACAERDDCITTYAGINCTCGPDCTCMGGEPNCVCESFEFHACSETAESAQ